MGATITTMAAIGATTVDALDRRLGPGHALGIRGY